MDLKEINKCNERLLTKLSSCLNNFADCVKEEDINNLKMQCRMNSEEAFQVLLSAYCGFDMENNSLDKYICKDYFPLMIKKLDVADYFNNPYYKNIKIPQDKSNNWAFGYKKYKKFEAFVCDDMIKLADGKIIPQIGYFENEFSYPCVFENGREWMLITPNEINTMKEAVNEADGKVLAIGLGLGYFQYMAHLKENVREIVIVEKDKNVVELFQKHILPQFDFKQKIKIVQSDAFDYVKNQMAKEKFDFVFADIWHDVSDGFDLYFEFKQFEKLLPKAKFKYWIEKTILCYV